MVRSPAVAIALLFAGVGTLAVVAGSRDGADPVPAVENRAELHELLRAAAAGREAMGLVDHTTRWAPTDCFAPPAPAVRFSASADAATHGGKVFLLYAKDRDAYLGLGAPGPARPTNPTEVTGLAGCSQVLVKEAFAPMEETESGIAACGSVGFVSYGGVAPSAGTAPTSFYASRAFERYSPFRPFLRPATKEGKRYGTGEARGLFVMMRLAPGTPRTDDGWVYGTIAADGTVTSAGRVASCMGCHVSAPHGRLFGLPPAD